MKKRIINGLLILVFILSLFIFSSCDNLSFRSIESATVNKAGELVLSYTDGTYQNLGTIKGDDGVDGKDGKDGEDGTDGKDGITTIVDESTGTSLVAAKALRSTVSIYSSFKVLNGQSITTASSAGAGIIYKCDKESGDAIIITNYHVIYDKNGIDSTISNDIKVFLFGSELSGLEIPATYIGGSINYDIAVLKITNSDLIRNSNVCAAEIKSSSLLHVGEDAIAIGNPKAEGIAVTKGIISTDSEDIQIAVDGTNLVTMRVMRIDTPVNSGNSGGGLFDSSGNLIGIVNAKISDTSVESIGYAIPSDIVTAVAENILYYCDGINCTTMQRPLLGITVTISNSYAKYDQNTGFINVIETSIIYEVSESSIAYGKLLVNDIIKSITIGDKTIEVTRQFMLIDSLLNAKIGDIVTITVERDGKIVNNSFTITESMITSY